MLLRRMAQLQRKWLLMAPALEALPSVGHSGRCWACRAALPLVLRAWLPAPQQRPTPCRRIGSGILALGSSSQRLRLGRTQLGPSTWTCRAESLTAAWRRPLPCCPASMRLPAASWSLESLLQQSARSWHREQPLTPQGGHRNQRASRLVLVAQATEASLLRESLSLTVSLR